MSMNEKIAIILLAITLAGCTGDSGDKALDSGDAAPGDTIRTPDPRGVILVVGTSLTAGYGIGAEYAYPAIIQTMIDSAGLPYRVVNAGISGETSAGGLRRIDWALQTPVSVLLLELGANDALRGLDPDSMQANLDRIIERTRARYPAVRVVVAGMEAPPNLGASYTAAFRGAYRTVADKYGATLIPFLLAGVATRPELNQQDGIHPTAAGQRIMADSVWTYLQPVLRASAR